ncbi:MAG: S8 family serine peptidase [Ignavibacteria bacterium]
MILIKALALFMFSASFLSSAFSQQVQVIIKLKENAPQDLIMSFKTGTPMSGTSSLSKLCRDFDVSDMRSLIKPQLISKFDGPAVKSSGLDRIFVFNTSKINLEQLLLQGSRNEHTEYIQVNGQLKLDDAGNKQIVPNDTYYPQQTYIEQSNLPPAWDITLGDSTILIGVIDSGLDFDHPDLRTSYKINYGEYGNGKQSNGIDDDANGFIDDWRGWDFTDEPFTGDPRRGDYLEPDNDPTDDNFLSHGTAVTGIINATFNNGIGIASVAPGCKVLVMRAFDAQGYGEEDDVANAVLYGMTMGVRVFNFSFGDYIFSNLLKDIVRFAYSGNAVIICSAGNDATDRLHYPSAYDEVISVAASDNTGNKAGFSSFGETVDIYATGLQNLTTVRTGKGSSQFGGDYDKLNGTSFAAPIVAGVAAMILSRNPELSNEEVRGILVSTTTLMPGQNSWDHIRASGRLNALNAINNYNNPSIARIHYPFQDFTTSGGIVPIVISAASPLFVNYSVTYGVGQKPAQWIPLKENVGTQALQDTILQWNLSSLPDTSYTLRLAINSNSGRSIEHRLIFFKDSLPPVITDVAFGTVLDKDNFSQLILFGTDKRTLGKIHYKRKNVNEPYQYVLADVGTPNLGFVTTGHIGVLSGRELQPNTEYEFYLEAVSLNGRQKILTDPAFTFITGNYINSYGYDQLQYSLPYSQAAVTPTDINGNGKPDLFLNDIRNNLKLNAYEFNAGSFTKISNDNWTEFRIARDVGDIDGDGKIELLMSRERNGYLYEAPSAGQLPVNVVWGDSVDGNFWSSRIADTDGDGIREILGFGNGGLRILENSQNTYNQVALLPLYGRDSTATSQNSIVEDLNGDGRNEVVIVNDYQSISTFQPQAAISVYTSTGNNTFSRIFLDSLSRFVKGDNVVSGDFDGDGKKEFAVGTISFNTDIVQYYSLYTYKASSANTYTILDITDVYNFKSYTETSTKAADIDNDGKDEVLVNTGTQFYVLKYDNTAGRFIPQYYQSNVNSFNQIAFDFNGNGIKELGLNTVDDTLLFFEKNIAFTGPATPLGLKGYSLDSNIVQLVFNPVTGADSYKIYRSDSTMNFALYDSVLQAGYSDVNVNNRKKYYYKITSVDNENSVRESMPTGAVEVYVHNKSKLFSANYETGGFISLKLSEKVSQLIPNLNTFVIQGIGNPKNAAIKNDFEYLLTLDNVPDNGSYSVKTIGLVDRFGSPVDSNSVAFSVNVVDEPKFYITKLELQTGNKLKVNFNLDVEEASAENTANYKFEPFGIQVQSAAVDNSDRKTVYVTLQSNAAIGATGRNYVLKASNIFSTDGIRIVDGSGSSFGLIFNKENLDEMYVYPNPYSISSNQDFVMFANITRDAAIDIYDLTGKFIVTVTETDGNGGVEWNLRNSSGDMISTGIYIYIATGKNSAGQEVEEKTGKFAVVR